MESIAVTKPNMAVLGQNRLAVTPFGLLACAFAEEILARNSGEEGFWPYVPLDLLEEGEEEQTSPAILKEKPIRIDVNLTLDWLRKEKALTERQKTTERILERVLQLQAQAQPVQSRETAVPPRGEAVPSPVQEIHHHHYHTHTVKQNYAVTVNRWQAGLPVQASSISGQNPARTLDSERTVRFSKQLQQWREEGRPLPKTEQTAAMQQIIDAAEAGAKALTAKAPTAGHSPVSMAMPPETLAHRTEEQEGEPVSPETRRLMESLGVKKAAERIEHELTSLIQEAKRGTTPEKARKAAERISETETRRTEGGEVSAPARDHTYTGKTAPAPAAEQKEEPSHQWREGERRGDLLQGEKQNQPAISEPRTERTALPTRRQSGMAQESIPSVSSPTSGEVRRPAGDESAKGRGDAALAAPQNSDTAPTAFRGQGEESAAPTAGTTAKGEHPAAAGEHPAAHSAAPEREGQKPQTTETVPAQGLTLSERGVSTGQESHRTEYPQTGSMPARREEAPEGQTAPASVSRTEQETAIHSDGMKKGQEGIPTVPTIQTTEPFTEGQLGAAFEMQTARDIRTGGELSPVLTPETEGEQPRPSASPWMVYPPQELTDLTKEAEEEPLSPPEGQRPEGSQQRTVTPANRREETKLTRREKQLAEREEQLARREEETARIQRTAAPGTPGDRSAEGKPGMGKAPSAPAASPAEPTGRGERAASVAVPRSGDTTFADKGQSVENAAPTASHGQGEQHTAPTAEAETLRGTAAKDERTAAAGEHPAALSAAPEREGQKPQTTETVPAQGISPAEGGVSTGQESHRTEHPQTGSMPARREEAPEGQTAPISVSRTEQETAIHSDGMKKGQEGIPTVPIIQTTEPFTEGQLRTASEMQTARDIRMGGELSPVLTSETEGEQPRPSASPWMVYPPQELTDLTKETEEEPLSPPEGQRPEGSQQRTVTPANRREEMKLTRRERQLAEREEQLARREEETARTQRTAAPGTPGNRPAEGKPVTEKAASVPTVSPVEPTGRGERASAAPAPQSGDTTFADKGQSVENVLAAEHDRRDTAPAAPEREGQKPQTTETVPAQGLTLSERGVSTGQESHRTEHPQTGFMPARREEAPEGQTAPVPVNRAEQDSAVPQGTRPEGQERIPAVSTIPTIPTPEPFAGVGLGTGTEMQTARDIRTGGELSPVLTQETEGEQPRPSANPWMVYPPQELTDLTKETEEKTLSPAEGQHPEGRQQRTVTPANRREEMKLTRRERQLAEREEQLARREEETARTQRTAAPGTPGNRPAEGKPVTEKAASVPTVSPVEPTGRGERASAAPAPQSGDTTFADKGQSVENAAKGDRPAAAGEHPAAHSAAPERETQKPQTTETVPAQGLTPAEGGSSAGQESHKTEHPQTGSMPARREEAPEGQTAPASVSRTEQDSAVPQGTHPQGQERIPTVSTIPTIPTPEPFAGVGLGTGTEMQTARDIRTGGELSPILTSETEGEQPRPSANPWLAYPPQELTDLTKETEEKPLSPPEGQSPEGSQQRTVTPANRREETKLTRREKQLAEREEQLARREEETAPRADRPAAPSAAPERETQKPRKTETVSAQGITLSEKGASSGQESHKTEHPQTGSMPAHREEAPEGQTAPTSVSRTEQETAVPQGTRTEGQDGIPTVPTIPAPEPFAGVGLGTGTEMQTARDIRTGGELSPVLAKETEGEQPRPSASPWLAYPPQELTDLTKETEEKPLSPPEGQHPEGRQQRTVTPANRREEMKLTRREKQLAEREEQLARREEETARTQRTTAPGTPGNRPAEGKPVTGKAASTPTTSPAEPTGRGERASAAAVPQNRDTATAERLSGETAPVGTRRRDGSPAPSDSGHTAPMGAGQRGFPTLSPQGRTGAGSPGQKGRLPVGVSAGGLSPELLGRLPVMSHLLFAHTMGQGGTPVLTALRQSIAQTGERGTPPAADSWLSPWGFGEELFFPQEPETAQTGANDNPVPYGTDRSTGGTGGEPRQAAPASDTGRGQQGDTRPGKSQPAHTGGLHPLEPPAGIHTAAASMTTLSPFPAGAGAEGGMADFSPYGSYPVGVGLEHREPPAASEEALGGERFPAAPAPSGSGRTGSHRAAARGSKAGSLSRPSAPAAHPSRRPGSTAPVLGSVLGKGRAPLGTLHLSETGKTKAPVGGRFPFGGSRQPLSEMTYLTPDGGSRSGEVPLPGDTPQGHTPGRGMGQTGLPGVEEYIPRPVEMTFPEPPAPEPPAPEEPTTGTSPTEEFGASDYVRSLPDWAQRFLNRNPGETIAGTRPIQTTAGELFAPALQEERVSWTAPNFRPPEQLSYKERSEREESSGSGTRTQEIRISDAEIHRMSDQVYRIIEDRIRWERRRLGL